MLGKAISTADFWTLRSAAIKGDLPTIKLSLEEHREKISEKNRTQLCGSAIYHERIELIDFFMSILEKPSVEKLTSGLYDAAEKKDAIILSHLINKFAALDIIVPSNNIHLALSKAIDKRLFENFKTLFETYRSSLDHTKMGGYFINAAANGKEEFLKFLMIESYAQIGSEAVNNAFRRVSEHGNIASMKFLFENCDDKINDEVIVEKLGQIAYDHPELSNVLLENKRILHILDCHPEIKEKMTATIHSPNYRKRHVEHESIKQALEESFQAFDHFVNGDASKSEGIVAYGTPNDYFKSKESTPSSISLKAQIDKLRSNPILTSFEHHKAQALESNDAIVEDPPSQLQQYKSKNMP